MPGEEGTAKHGSPRFAEMVVNTPKSLSVAAALHPDVSDALDAAQADAVTESVGSSRCTRSPSRPRGRQEVVPVERLQTVTVVHKTSRAGDPHRHVHFQIGTRVWAAGTWRGLDTVALFKQQGSIRALGTGVLAAHPGVARALDRHDLTLDPVTGEVLELAPFNAVMSKSAGQVEKNISELEDAWAERRTVSESTWTPLHRFTDQVYADLTRPAARRTTTPRTFSTGSTRSDIARSTPSVDAAHEAIAAATTRQRRSTKTVTCDSRDQRRGPLA